MRKVVFFACSSVIFIVLMLSAQASEISDFDSAVLLCDMQKARAILIKNPELIRKKSEQGYTPLHVVAIGVVKGDRAVEMIRMLISRGADPNAADNLADIPLHIAARNGCGEIARALIEGGAEVNPRNRAGQTPLGVARECEKYNVADLLNLNGGKE